MKDFVYLNKIIHIIFPRRENIYKKKLLGDVIHLTGTAKTHTSIHTNFKDIAALHSQFYEIKIENKIS